MTIFVATCIAAVGLGLVSGALCVLFELLEIDGLTRVFENILFASGILFMLSAGTGLVTAITRVMLAAP